MNPIPLGWTSAEIGELGELKLGKMLDRARNSGVHVSYLRNVNVRWFQFDLADLKTLAATSEEIQELSVRNGDLFICEGGEPGRSAVWRGGDRSLVYQKALHRFRSNGSALPEWVMYSLKHGAGEGLLLPFLTGSTIKHLPQTQLRRFTIPVPPILEQRRIADKLDDLLAKVDACRERLDRIPSLLKRFRQAVLAAATSGELTRDWREARGRNANWATVPLGTLGQVSGGVTKNAGRVGANVMRRYLRVANVYADRLILDEIAEIATTQVEFERTRLVPGDIVIVEGNGSLDQVGRAAIWRGEIEDCTHQNHLIRWRSDGHAVPAFVLYSLLSPKGRSDLASKAKSSSGLHTLSMSKVREVLVPLPEADEQVEIVERTERLLKLGEEVELRALSGLRKLARLTPSILAKAFRGELVPQDPNDEPASELLARIRAGVESAPSKKPKRASAPKSGTRRRKGTPRPEA